MAGAFDILEILGRGACTFFYSQDKPHGKNIQNVAFLRYIFAMEIFYCNIL